jgi:mono/diheme cytochrome c family protein
MTRAWLGLALGLAACGGGGNEGGPPAFRMFNPGKAPAELAQGERLFNTYCTSCHGYYGKGEGLGPSLLDTLYLAPRLPDAAIENAVTNGVPQTHWRYGAMPKVARVGPAELRDIVPYVRWLQQRADADPNIRKSRS